MPILDEGKLTQLTTSGGPPGMDFLSQASGFVKEFKGALEMLAKLKGANLAQAGEDIKNLVPAGEQKGFGNILSLIRNLGLGDIPIGEILRQIAPHSANELAELAAKHVRPKE